MNKTIIAVIILGLLGLGVTSWLITRSDKNQTASDSFSSMPSTSSINELLARNENLKCTISSNVDSQTTSGTSYISGGRLRGDYVMTTNGVIQNLSVVNDGEYAYSWSEDTNSGFRTKISNPQSNDNNVDDVQPQQPVDQEQQLNIDCQEWQVDETVFLPPGNVEFIDYTEQIDQLQQSQGQSGQLKQNACSKISDPKLRSDCEMAL